jgi:hypothetical protein
VHNIINKDKGLIMHARGYDGFIYIWINIITGKKYIGSHKGHIHDGYVSSSSYFLADYRKSPNEFSRDILEYIIGDIPCIRKIETEYLMKNSVSSSDEFYNKSNSAFGANMTGKNNPMYGVLYTDKRRQKQKNTWKKIINSGYAPCNKGVPMSQEQKEKMSDTWEVTEPSGIIICIVNMRKYCLDHNLNQSAMSSVARGNRRQHKGYLCKKIKSTRDNGYTYTKWVSAGPIGKPSYGQYNGNSKEIVVNGIKYNTMTEASNQTGLSMYKLRKILNDKN